MLLSGILAHLILQKVKWRWWTDFNVRLGKLRNATTFLIGLLTGGGVFSIIMFGILSVANEVV
jgi:hypothetical protein